MILHVWIYLQLRGCCVEVSCWDQLDTVVSVKHRNFTKKLYSSDVEMCRVGSKQVTWWYLVVS